MFYVQEQIAQMMELASAMHFLIDCYGDDENADLNPDPPIPEGNGQEGEIEEGDEEVDDEGDEEYDDDDDDDEEVEDQSSGEQ